MRPGTHAALCDARSRRNPISRRCSFRKRAQSARRSSDTNSPGSSGSGGAGDPAVWLGPEFTPTSLWKLWTTLGCRAARASLGTQAARPGDFTTRGPVWGHSNGGGSPKSSERARTSAAGSSPRRLFRPWLEVSGQRLGAGCRRDRRDRPRPSRSRRSSRRRAPRGSAEASGRRLADAGRILPCDQRG
jgi:hypothetical protein